MSEFVTPLLAHQSQNVYHYSMKLKSFMADPSIRCLFVVLYLCIALPAFAANPVIRPTKVAFRDLPRVPQGFVSPLRERIEGIPPWQRPGRIPDIRELKNVTFDATKPRSAFAPTLGTGFEGITQGGYIPGEPSAAAGPLNIFSTGNISVTVTDKDGSNRVEVFGKTFWGAPSSDDSISDPVCMYDAQRGRFIALAFTTDNNGSYSHYLLAISQTDDARGNWYQYVFDWSKDNSTSTTNWGDYEEFGISTDKFVISSQQFHHSSYKYQKLRVFNRDSLYQGLAVSYVDFVNFANQVFVTKPGRNLSADSTIYLLATVYNGGSKVTVGKITGPSNNPTLSFGTSVTVQSYGAPVKAPGGSGTATVDAGDARTLNFIVRNGVLHIAWHFGVSISGTTVDALRYLKLNVAAWPPTVLNDETYSAASTYMYYPNVMVDSAGTMFMGFDRSSTTEYPSSYVTGKRRTDAAIQASALAKAGTAVTTQSRWGDFTGGDMDESASTDTASYAWYAGQWTKAANVFGTWISQLKYSYCKINGQVLFDSDGDTSTTGDRSALSGVTVLLKHGSTVIASTNSDVEGDYSFRYVDPLNYTVVLSPPQGDGTLPAIPGSGGSSQVRVNNFTLSDSVTGTQVSAGNTFVVTNTWRSISSNNWSSTAAWLPGSTPPSTGNVVIAPGISVTVNGNDTCSNLTINGTLQFDGVGNRSLVINGTPTLNSGSVLNAENNTLVFNGNPIAGTPSLLSASSGSSLIFNGSVSGHMVPSSINALKNLTVNNSAGVSLESNLSLNGTLALSGGALMTGADTITLTSTAVISRFAGMVIGSMGAHFADAASRVFPVGTANGYSPATVSATTGSFPTIAPVVVTAMQGAAPGVPGTNVLQRYWSLDGGSVTAASLTFQYLSSDVVGAEAAYSLSRKNPVTAIWEIEGGSVNALAHTGSITNANPSSLWTLGEAGALPIQLMSFTGRMIQNNLVQLEWTTLSEVNTYGFYVQRRERNDIEFTTVSALIPGAGTSLQEHSYAWVDTLGGEGAFYYRLRQVDLNGTVSYSNDIVIHEVAAVETEMAPKLFRLFQNYPNPFNPSTTIRFSVEKPEPASLKVFNMLGEQVAHLYDGFAEPGKLYRVTFDASRLGSGLYIYRFTTPSRSAVQKMVVLK